MRILLDTNVWRYLVNASALPRLRQAARKSRHCIVVAPAVMYEALRTGDHHLRKELVHAMALSDWLRLMPEAYSEAMEVRDEVFRLRPGWRRVPAEPTLHQRLRFDWRRSRGGFWDRAVHEMEREAVAVADTGVLGRARTEARELRDRAKGHPNVMREFPLDSLRAQPIAPTDGWNGDWVDLWRLEGMYCWGEALRNPDHAYEQWLGGDVITSFLRIPSADLMRFWCYEVERHNLPRHWMRTAMTYLQQFHKVTDGTPVDAQIGTYLVEADLFFSADKNMVRFAQRCHSEAPFPCATAVLVSATDVIKPLLQTLAQPTLPSHRA